MAVGAIKYLIRRNIVCALTTLKCDWKYLIFYLNATLSCLLSSLSLSISLSNRTSVETVV